MWPRPCGMKTAPNLVSIILSMSPTSRPRATRCWRICRSASLCMSTQDTPGERIRNLKLIYVNPGHTWWEDWKAYVCQPRTHLVRGLESLCMSTQDTPGERIGKLMYVNPGHTWWEDWKDHVCQPRTHLVGGLERLCMSTQDTPGGRIRKLMYVNPERTWWEDWKAYVCQPRTHLVRRLETWFQTSLRTVKFVFENFFLITASTALQDHLHKPHETCHSEQMFQFNEIDFCQSENKLCVDLNLNIYSERQANMKKVSKHTHLCLPKHITCHYLSFTCKATEEWCTSYYVLVGQSMVM